MRLFQDEVRLSVSGKDGTAVGDRLTQIKSIAFILTKLGLNTAVGARPDVRYTIYANVDAWGLAN